MPRVARVVIPGMPHHVTQRGNNQQAVFFVDDDRRVYLSLLKEQSDRYALGVLGYCVMTNHVHIVGVPAGEESLAKAIGRANWRYAQYVNRLHGRSGHLWQSRFYSCGLDEVHTWRALRYVERNPVRARMVRVAWRFPWSSAPAHVGGQDAAEVLDLKTWRAEWKPTSWREALREPEDEALTARVRQSTHTGRPLAGDRLIARLEHKLGRRLRPAPVGRPRGSKKPKRKPKST